MRIDSCSPSRRTPHSRASSTGFGVGELQRLDDVAAHQVGLGEAGQLEDAAADREHAPLLVGDDETRVGRGVVVVEQLEEEAEAAVPAGGRLRREALAGVDVERALLAPWADVVRHGGRVAGRALDPALPAEEHELADVVATIQPHDHQ